MDLVIRRAESGDALAICHLLKHSISELCADDHKNDPSILMRWLNNKTPELILAWMQHPNNTMLVAIDQDDVIAVGAVTNMGEVTLNYVHPLVRFKGVSRAMMSALEKTAKEQGNAKCTLASTGTAKRFYLSSGYTEQSAQTGVFGTQTYSMIKQL